MPSSREHHPQDCRRRDLVDAPCATLARAVPRQLLIVTTGDITNDALLALVALHLDAIDAALDGSTRSA